jgi:hypothetical protein
MFDKEGEKQMNKEYNITLFGFDFIMSLAPHAYKRSRDRNVCINDIIESLEDSQEAIADYVQNDTRFVIKNVNKKIMITICFHYDWIDIITVWNGLDFLISEGEDVIEISGNQVKYYKFTLTKNKKTNII